VTPPGNVDFNILQVGQSVTLRDGTDRHRRMLDGKEFDIFEEERSLLGADPWPHGLKANYANLERFIEYSYDQNLLESRIPVESLFPEQVLDT